MFAVPPRDDLVTRLSTFELYDQFPPTDDDRAATERVADAFAESFDERATTLTRQAASEDFSDIPARARSHLHVLAHRRDRPRRLPGRPTARPDRPGHPGQSRPRLRAGHPTTLHTGTQALVVAALAWLAK
jgi:metal-dependent amidase/aminoacylase/carboxypeptidase family protein